MNAPDVTAQDAIAQVAHALRIAASQDADRGFWRQRERDMIVNHDALYVNAACVLAALDLGVLPSKGAVERLRDAVAERDRIYDATTAYLNGRAA